MFVAKYNSAGQALWAYGVGGNKTTGGMDGAVVGQAYVACDSLSNVYATGSYFNCDMLFPGTTLKEMDGFDIYS